MSIGELAMQMNCCRTVSSVLHTSGGGPFVLLLVVAGIALIALLVLGWRAHPRFGAIELFVVSTAAVILVYGAEPRFWIAAVPFMIVYALFGLERLARWKVARVAILSYGVAFAIGGAAWLGYSVVLSTSGHRFPQLWSREVGINLAATYQVAFGEGGPGLERQAIPTALELLRRYEPLARNGRTDAELTR